MMPHGRTEACKRQLEALGWAVVPAKVRVKAPGAPRIWYLCADHREYRPPGWLEARAAVIRQRVQRQPRERRISLKGVTAPTGHFDSARRAAAAWMLVEAVGSTTLVARAFGVSRQRLHQMVDDYKATIARRQRSAAGWVEPWAQRLRAAGAVP